MIRLISLDLDGTLLDPGGRVTSAAKAAIAKARAAGVRVVLNTGRPAPEALWFAQEAGLDQADYFPTLDAARNALSREVRAGVTILVKASRSMAFEKIVDFLLTNVPQ